ncbi:hypothetical protein OSSY52_00490 [Tepiditoga spiralis]|uniref:Uncharacterized protein n=1 Tax=Tepiditoga spiralis TaxID=2108365 RepID=A0A7G1G195_9BACT|nr:hypothetical protein [Tepiditoga spiralis]BBE29908.1 hypothetical protein OSSY52_00490 [Tepiditoga spiralis]
MKKTKRGISWLILFTFILTMMPMNAFATIKKDVSVKSMSDSQMSAVVGTGGGGGGSKPNYIIEKSAIKWQKNYTTYQLETIKKVADAEVISTGPEKATLSIYHTTSYAFTSGITGNLSMDFTYGKLGLGVNAAMQKTKTVRCGETFTIPPYSTGTAYYKSRYNCEDGNVSVWFLHQKLDESGTKVIDSWHTIESAGSYKKRELDGIIDSVVVTILYTKAPFLSIHPEFSVSYYPHKINVNSFSTAWTRF